ncbi:HD domain-containing protein [Rhizobium leguminosarum bv. viciae]|uniref:HD domain-containing protein n=1 Tax=Rhizobium leguminosarum TaxID=384 RepID=UPI0010387111|nr:HD domain-containing protein [Rhizobium leguminosarum]TCA18491.1 HD domain-containing protein [Rhizobium leguminosarum bv. viciae]
MAHGPISIPWALVGQLSVRDYIAPVSLPDPADVRSDVDTIYRLFDLQRVVRFFGQKYWEEETVEKGAPSATLELENVAAHSFHVARCVPLLAPHFPWIDRAKAMEMALVHDEPEIVTGDKDPVGSGQGTNTHAFNVDRRIEKDLEERRALDALASSMRRSLREAYLSLAQELLTDFSEEARFVKAVDKLQALAFVRLRKGAKIIPEHAAFTIRYSRLGVRRFPPLQRHFMRILQDLLDDVEAGTEPQDLEAFYKRTYSNIVGADEE